ncbi:FAD-dependent monooxygenase [Bosea psychrotolerans]|uniref:Salicylate hydroxylase n=1 Tax=Bosea psychrotolerans TaxID=1871628 RepID=A0A2S4MH67_9HYPH|nr:FAD-dependent monooxygenase [Bosea psychrotolerans]POR54098.1 salicylate hydroxylase [Bosea psychrotolerans]
MPTPHILIAGAGIGGLTAAIALARRGIAVTLAEKRTGFGETGAGLQLSPNAGRVLAALDLGLALKRVGVTAERLVIRRWRNGAEIAGMPMTVAPTETPFRVLKRPDLHMLLLDAARQLPNIRLVVGRGLQEIVQTQDGISATLVSDAGQIETVQALGAVGADGLWSRLRELSGDTAPPAFTGFEAWRTLVPAGRDKPAAEITLHLGAGRHAVHYPVASRREINLVIIREAREAREGWSREGDARLLASHLAGAAPDLRRLAGAAGQWQVWSLFDRTPAVMAQGRIALLGDAAHPVLPFFAQGAALAIEDAAVLAHELAAHLERDGASGVPAAMAAYAQARAERVARVQATSRSNGRAYHLGRPWSLGRDLVMRRLGPDGMRRRYDWLYDWRAPV